MTFPNGGFNEDGVYVVNPKSRPTVTIYGSFSTDECGFLSKEEQAVFSNLPAGYSSAQTAQVARDLVAARETLGAFEALVAQIESDRAAENAVTGIAPAQNSPSDHRIGF